MKLGARGKLCFVQTIDSHKGWASSICTHPVLYKALGSLAAPWHALQENLNIPQSTGMGLLPVYPDAVPFIVITYRSLFPISYSHTQTALCKLNFGC